MANPGRAAAPTTLMMASERLAKVASCTCVSFASVMVAVNN